MMLFTIRRLVILWSATFVAILLSIGFGKAFPVPMLEWASTTVYLHDTRTGVNYPLQQQPANEGTRTIISGVQLVPSPENNYVMTLTGKPTGLDIDIADANGTNLYRLRSEPESNINNALWINDNKILLLRVISLSGDLQVRRLDLELGTESEIATVDDNLFIVSPHNQWILLNDSTAGTQIINTLNDRAYEVYPVSLAYAWSDDGRYFASRAEISDRLGFQLLDTQTGEFATGYSAPTRLLWSSNHRDLIAHDEHEITIYREMQAIELPRFHEPIVRVIWSPDEQLALIVTESSNSYKLYFVDIEQAQNIQPLPSIPLQVEINSITWAHGSPIITYVIGDSQRNVTAVYRIQIETGTTDLITQIPEQIRQVRYLETLATEEDIP